MIMTLEMRHMFECENCEHPINIDAIEYDARIIFPMILIKCPKCKVYFKLLTMKEVESERDEID